MVFPPHLSDEARGYPPMPGENRCLEESAPYRHAIIES
jgi:hypothetical protein